MAYLRERVFDPILDSDRASAKLKQGVRMTMSRMGRLDAGGMVQYYWSAVIGTERSTSFARLMKAEGFMRFEELLEDFRERFDQRWLSS